MAEATNGTVRVTFKRTTNRDALARSIIYEWLKPPASVTLTDSESGSFWRFAELVSALAGSEGLPFDPALVKADKAVALAGYNAWLDMDEQDTDRLETELRRTKLVTDPALLPTPSLGLQGKSDKDKKTAPENAAED